MLSLRRDDVTTTRTVVRITNFNPRLREGGDHPNTAPEATTENFNPRLREGGDDIYHAPSCCKKISIHASVKEATRKKVLLRSPTKRISIHASAKEATDFEYFVGDAIEFQSTPPRRRRQKIMVNCGCFHGFQSTPPRRRRPQHIVIPQLSCTYLVSTTFLSAIFSFISQYVVLFFLF